MKIIFTFSVVSHLPHMITIQNHPVAQTTHGHSVTGVVVDSMVADHQVRGKRKMQ